MVKQLDSYSFMIYRLWDCLMEVKTVAIIAAIARPPRVKAT